MLQNGVVTANSIVPEVPINQPCAHEMPGAHAEPAPMSFRR